MIDAYYSWFSEYSQGSNEMIFIGHLIPGLIASWMDRQGVAVTVSTVLISGSVVNLILFGNTSEPMSEFSLEDINPNSDYYGEYIGPETFRDDISLYYFGKAG